MPQKAKRSMAPKVTRSSAPKLTRSSAPKLKKISTLKQNDTINKYGENVIRLFNIFFYFAHTGAEKERTDEP